MLTYTNYDSKDFSMELPEIIARLRALSSLCINSSDAEAEMTTDLMKGLASILWDTGEELHKINEALYGTDENQDRESKGSPSANSEEILSLVDKETTQVYQIIYTVMGAIVTAGDGTLNNEQNEEMLYACESQLRSAIECIQRIRDTF